MNNLLNFLKINIVLGLIITLSFNDFFPLWVGMEMISLLIMGMIFLKKATGIGGIGFQKFGVLIKYMFLQIFSGMIILFSFSLSNLLLDFSKMGLNLGLHTQYYGINMIMEMFSFMFIFSIALKLGLFPGHLWVVDVFSGLTFHECFILGTIPKYAPFLLLNGDYCESNNLLMLLGGLSILLGSFQGLNYSDMRQIMGGSSIMNTGWLMLGFLFGGLNMFFMMYLIYSYTLWVLFNLIRVLNIQTLGAYKTWFSYTDKMLFSFAIFIMMGMPCGVMFFYKIFLIMGSNNVSLFFFLMLSGYTMFVFYSRMMSQVWNYDFFGVMFLYTSVNRFGMSVNKYITSLVTLFFPGMVILFKFL
ncbi:NADH dehydrogenase subunit 2 (mitochondrion) [Ciona intestinalis B CG-2006]|uniref:NADH-ubiquinone oxidoreductase chain 2 n=1 Tax=Ciona intestinalis TaxID=7719 RepID=A7M7Z7_CIOIN|nr:NADH dehydrogenase subunit 2 [Ciona intestinalis B CG-2006]CAL23350.2 NADH dehydrogenase subunit 2 [Ciona intestinalis]|eukprot:YP_006341027.1 NADH dehydrogenase subunit 2 (mitochondrion) [Ciona intestinalis B CG-2006]